MVLSNMKRLVNLKRIDTILSKKSWIRKKSGKVGFKIMLLFIQVRKTIMSHHYIEKKSGLLIEVSNIYARPLAAEISPF